MKYVGKDGLKVNGKEVWHEGNFNPSSKSDTGHAHTIDSTTGNLPTNRLTEPAYVTGSITRTARPLFDVLRADRTAFLPATQIIIEKSTDAGVTWADAGVSDTTKRRLFTGQRPSIIIPLKNGVKSTDCMIRVTITGMRYNVPDGTAETAKYNYWNSSYVSSSERYFAAQDGWIWVNANSDKIYMKVERATGGNSTNWITDREAFLSGWTGGNYFSLSGGTFGGSTSQTSNYWNWRFTFRTCSTKLTFNDADLATYQNTQAQSIQHIKISGQNVWATPNNYMYHDHLYNWDENKNVIFPAELKASTFKNSSGTEVSYSGHTHDDRYYTESEADTKLSGKVDKVSGKGLSTEDYTTTEKNKLAGIETGANNYTHPSTHPPSIIVQDANNRFVTDTEKAIWNGKEPAFSKNTAFNKNFETAAANIKMNGAQAAVGTSANVARADHVHPVDTSRAAASHNHTKSQITDFAHSHAIGDLPVAASGTSSTTQLVRADDSRLSNARAPTTHTHTKSQITDMPTRLSQFQNDIGAGAGLNIVVSSTEPPQLTEGDWWYKEI